MAVGQLPVMWPRPLAPEAYHAIADLQGFPIVLHEAGFSDRDINGVLHGNALRFFRQAWTH